jgi:hypothetical protein
MGGPLSGAGVDASVDASGTGLAASSPASSNMKGTPYAGDDDDDDEHAGAMATAPVPNAKSAARLNRAAGP